MNFRNRYFQNNRAVWLICAAFFILALLPNSFRAQGEKAVGNKSPDIKVDKLPPVEKRWAVIIGIDEYENGISPLRGSVNDAISLRNVLVKYAGFPPKQVILLTTGPGSPKPDKRAIVDSLVSLRSKVPKDGLFLFAFSGHGVSIDDRAFLVPADGKANDILADLRTYSLDIEEIRDHINRIKAEQVLMVLDACRNNPGRGNSPNLMTEAYTKFSFDTANSGIKIFVTLFASSVGERAYEFTDKDTKQVRGYFSYAIEEALSGRGGTANEKGEITLDRVIKYVQTVVADRVKQDEEKHQHPSVTISEGYKANDLILAVVPVRERPPIDKNVLVILSPADNADVDYHNPIRGRTAYPKRNHYIVVTPFTVNKSWVMDDPATVNADGTWTGAAIFGEGTVGINDKFLVRVLATDSVVPRGEMKNIPSDAVFSKAIVVTRIR